MVRSLKTMKLRILNTDGIIAEAEVDAVTLPGVDGQLTPMSGHDLLLTPLKKGTIYYRPIIKGTPADRKEYLINGGIAEIVKGAVMVFTSDQSR